MKTASASVEASFCKAQDLRCSSDLTNQHKLYELLLIPLAQF